MNTIEALSIVGLVIAGVSVTITVVALGWALYNHFDSRIPILFLPGWRLKFTSAGLRVSSIQLQNLCRSPLRIQRVWLSTDKGPLDFAPDFSTGDHVEGVSWCTGKHSARQKKYRNEIVLMPLEMVDYQGQISRTDIDIGSSTIGIKWQSIPSLMSRLLGSILRPIKRIWRALATDPWAHKPTFTRADCWDPVASNMNHVCTIHYADCLPSVCQATLKGKEV